MTKLWKGILIGSAVGAGVYAIVKYVASHAAVLFMHVDDTDDTCDGCHGCIYFEHCYDKPDDAVADNADGSEDEPVS